MCSIGIVLNEMAKHEKALDSYNKSLEIRIRVLGHEHPLVADSFYNIASLHRKQGQHDLEAGCFRNAW